MQPRQPVEIDPRQRLAPCPAASQQSVSGQAGAHDTAGNDQAEQERKSQCQKYNSERNDTYAEYRGGGPIPNGQ
jgi:hypothetical protein